MRVTNAGRFRFRRAAAVWTLATWLGAAAIAAAPDTPTTFGDGLEAYQSGDYVRALGIWRPLAELGSPEAQFNLGLLFQQGNGVEADAARAYEWYRKAAEGGYPRAQYRVAEMLERGVGVRADLARAHFWFGMARRARYEDAKKRQRRLAKKMTSSQIAMAELRMRQQKRREKGRPDDVSLD